MSKRFALLDILTILILLLASQGLFAQSKKNFKQELKWQADKNVMEYRVELRNIDDGSKQTFTTSSNKITVSLSAGDYEYRVIAYDFLGRESSSSEWRKFKVLKALAPSVETPKSVEADLGKDSNLEMPVEITNIEEESKVELINEATNEVIKGSLATKEEAGKTVAASVVFPKVDEGDWKLRVTNPSGLSTESQVISIEDKAVSDEETEDETIRESKDSSVEEKTLTQEESEKEELTKKEAEELAKKEAEAKALEEELAAQKAEEEAKRLAEEEKLRVIEEQRRLQEERIAERQRQAEEMRKRQEEAMERARLAEEKQREEAQAMAQRREEQKILAEERAKAAAEREAKAQEAEKKFQEAQEELENARIEEERLRLEEEERLAREREAEEKERLRLAKIEARKKRPKKDFCFQYGIGLIMPVSQNDYFDMYSSEDFKFIPAIKNDITFLPIKIGKSKLGFGLDIMTSGFTNEDQTYLSFNTLVLLANLDLALRYPLVKDKLFVGAKAGAGLSFFYLDVSYNDSSNRQRVSSPLYGLVCANGELSLIYIPWKGFIMELGASYQHVFADGMDFNILSPFMTLGVRF